MSEGVDYAWGRPGGAALASAGKKFAMRYVPYSGDGGKGLTLTEFKDLRSHGLSVGLVMEIYAGDAKQGYSRGVTLAKMAQAGAAALGLGTLPIYFCVDFDANVGQRSWDTNYASAIKGFLDGIASVIGRARTGIYGGYYVVEWALSHGYARWGWETYAWSGGHVSTRAHLLQYNIYGSLNGAAIDLDRSLKTDFGQYPRPAATPTPVGKFLRHEVVVTGGIPYTVWSVARYTHRLYGSLTTTFKATSRAIVKHGSPGFWLVTKGFGAPAHYYVYGKSRSAFAVRSVYQWADGSIHYYAVNPAT